MGLLEEALAYAAEGWRVFPCYTRHPATGGCSCRQACTSPAKHPRTTNGLTDATADEAQISAWWGKWPHANIAIATGAESGIVVVDVDTDKGGQATIEKLEAEHGPFSDTLRSNTGGGGYHLIYQHPGQAVKTRARAFGAGVDSRGDGGYIIAPPSTHISGRVYAWQTPVDPIRPFPPFLLATLTSRSRLIPANVVPLRRRGSAGTPYGLAALEGLLDELEAAPEGARNDTLNAVTYRIGRLIGGGELDQAATLSFIEEAALSIGLGQSEVKRTMASAVGAGLSQPLSAPPRASTTRTPAPPPAPASNSEPPAQTEASAPSDVDKQFAASVELEAQKIRIRRAAERLIQTETVPVEEPQILTLRQRLALPRPPIQFRVAGWHPERARIVLSAQYKAGKTTVTGNLARSLADSEPFLSSAEVSPVAGTIWILDFEMSPNMLDSWLEAQRIQNDDQVFVVPMRGLATAFDLFNPDVYQQWVQRLKAAGAAYIILDCLRPILDSLGLDEQHDAGRFLLQYDQLLADADVAETLVVHHMGHVAERARGDSRIRDWPDVEWRLVREKPEDPASPRYLSAFGRDVEVGESRLHYDPYTRRLSLGEGSRQDASARRALADILEAIESEPGLSRRQIEDRVASETYSREAVRAGVLIGVRDGLIRTEPGARRAILHYSSTPVRGSAPPVRQRTADECASASIDGALRTTTHKQPSARPENNPQLDQGNL
jgi:hypothetical protein